jgi:hypothetical protein
MSLILALTVFSWAQTATQSTPSTPDQSVSEKAKCACCDKMAKSDAKDGHAACMRTHDSKEMAACCTGKDDQSCCEGKDAASCMKDGKMAKSCCKGKEGMNCDAKASKDCGQGCCGSSKGEKTA